MKNSIGTSKDRASEVRRGEGETVRRALGTGADEILESELEEAYDRLEASGSLSRETIEVISKMATRIRDGILASPVAALEHDPESDVRGTVVDLFGLDPERDFDNERERDDPTVARSLREEH